MPAQPDTARHIAAPPGQFELYEATFQIEDTHVTVTVIDVR